MSEATPALLVRGLTHRFGARTAVRALDLTVWPGDVYGFLGPNGAGKTTALRCVLGLLQPEAGDVAVFGERGVAARRHVGAMVETPAFHGWMSGSDNLLVSAAYAGLGDRAARDEVARVLDRVGLTERARDRAGGYSLGMRQRLAIARALLGRPRLLLLDEPTNGLDPVGMREMRELVRSLALHDGITVFLSSHLLPEVQAVCNRVGILSEGELRAEGPVAELLAQDASPIRHVEVAVDAALLARVVAELPGAALAGPGGEGRARVALRGVRTADLVRALVAAGAEIEAVVPERKNLEDVFLAATGSA